MKTKRTTVTYDEQTGSNISLVCSSGLTSSQETSYNIPVLFTFWNESDLALQSIQAEHYTKSVVCNSSFENVVEGNWLISRQNSPTHDCTLTILNLSPQDDGDYSCAGLLTQNEIDWSKSTIDLDAKDQMSSAYPIYIIVGIALVIVAIIVILVILVIRARPRPRPSPGPSRSSSSELH